MVRAPGHSDFGGCCFYCRGCAGLFPNDGDGNAWGDKKRGLPPALAKRGYKVIDPGRYQNLSDDFTAQITAF